MRGITGQISGLKLFKQLKGKIRKIEKSSVKELVGKRFVVVDYSSPRKQYKVKMLDTIVDGKEFFWMDIEQMKRYTKEVKKVAPPPPSVSRPSEPIKIAGQKIKKVVKKVAQGVDLVKVIKKVMPAKSTYTVLQNFLVKDGYLTVTDLDLFFHKKIENLVDGMYQLVGANFERNDLDPQEFPDTLYADIYVCYINRLELIDKLSKVLPFVSTDILRRPLPGICLDFGLHRPKDEKKGGRFMISTDGVVINVIPFKTEKEDLKEETEFIIGSPIKTLLCLKALTSEYVKMKTDKDRRMIAFEGENGDEIIERTFEGPYPNWRAVSSALEKQFVFNKEQMIAALKILSPYVLKFSHRDLQHMKLIDNGKSLIVACKQSEDDSRASKRVEVPLVDRKEVGYRPQIGIIVMPLHIEEEEATTSDEGFLSWINMARVVNVLESLDGDNIYMGYRDKGLAHHFYDSDLSAEYSYKEEKKEEKKAEKKEKVKLTFTQEKYGRYQTGEEEAKEIKDYKIPDGYELITDTDGQPLKFDEQLGRYLWRPVAGSLIYYPDIEAIFEYLQWSDRHPDTGQVSMDGFALLKEFGEETGRWEHNILARSGIPLKKV